MGQRLVFFGNERLATGVTTEAPTLQALVAAGYEVCAVVSQHEISKSRKPRELEISVVAGRHGIPVLLPEKLEEIADALQGFKAEAGVLVAYGQIVPESVINLFPRSIINIHPSLLPRHRGPTPVESIILNGQTETGVSLMGLVKKMDAGPIYAQTKVALSGDEAKQALADKLLNVGKDMLLANLPAILDGSLEPHEQDDTQATYDPLIKKEDGELDWQQPAAFLARQVRAYASWPKSRANIGGRDVIVTAAHATAGSGTPGVVYLDGKTLGMYTPDGILIIDKLIPTGKKEMSGADFLLGYSPGS